MDEIIDSKELKEIVGEERESDRKVVSIISDGKQFSIRIPKKYAEEAKIHQGDKFEFELAPLDEGFELKGKVIKNS